MRELVKDVNYGSKVIKKTLALDKGSGKPGTDKAGRLSKAQIEQIAKDKLPDINTSDIDQAIKVVAGTARSMGIEVENG